MDLSKTNSIEDLRINGKVDFTKGIMMKDSFHFYSLDSQDKIPFLLLNSFTLSCSYTLSRNARIAPLQI